MTDMSDSLVATIERSSERAWLRRCGEHNANLGKKIVADAVARRLRDLDFHDALKARPEAHSVEERVRESLRVYRELLKCPSQDSVSLLSRLSAAEETA
jgi:hypothetical protein